MKRVILILAAVLLLALGAQTALAEGYEWRDHAAPFDFLFGNHIDTHQQSRVGGKGLLEGFFYIKFTGEVVDGLPEATHANCPASPEVCTVGWILHGLPMRARLLQHGHGQHPQWCVDPADLPRQRGYSHFHWLGAPEHAHGLVVGQEYDGYLLKLTARESFFFQHHGGFVVRPGIDTATHGNIVTECE